MYPYSPYSYVIYVNMNVYLFILVGLLLFPHCIYIAYDSLN